MPHRVKRECHVLVRWHKAEKHRQHQARALIGISLGTESQGRVNCLGLASLKISAGR